MFEEYAATAKPCTLPELILNKVWHVKADDSYDVSRNTWGDGYILLRTISGEGELFTIRDHYCLTEGSMLIISSNDIKRYRCASDNWHFYWFEFQGEDNAWPLASLLFPASLLREKFYLENIFSMLRSNTQVDRNYATANFAYLLNSWLHMVSVELSGDALHSKTIRIVIERMHTKLKDNWTVRDMARCAGMGERNFREIFKNEVGIPPKQYYDSLRLEYAKALLAEGKCTVQEASDTLNFSSQFYFSRAFKRYFGFPPSSIIN